MTQNDINLLKSRVDRTVRFHCKDGETIVGTVHFVSEKEQDVIYDLISSDRSERYESFADSAHQLTFDEIDHVSIPDA